MTYVGHPTDIRPQRRGRTAKETNIVCDIRFDYIGRATSDLPYFLFGGRAAGQHRVGVRLSALVVWVGKDKQMSPPLKAACHAGAFTRLRSPQARFPSQSLLTNFHDVTATQLHAPGDLVTVSDTVLW